MNRTEPLQFYGGTMGALAPFAVFLAGVTWLGLSGAPDERGFWPILLFALGTGIVLCRDRNAYAETVIIGMSRPVVMLMVMAWLLAGVFGSLMNASGFIDGLIWLAAGAGVAGGGFAIAAFLVCAVVSTATGTSLGTILLCSPLLFPAGVSLGSDAAVLAGAIIGGATFGDNISPVSDTTIASATTQDADLGGVVRSRLKYALAAAAVALVGYGAIGGSGEATTGTALLAGDPRSLPMLLAPLVALFLLLRRHHLVIGLSAGIGVAIVVGLALGLIAPTQIIGVDTDNFISTGVVLDGMQRGVGVSIFTILLMGLVAGVEATGMLDRIIEFARGRIRSARGAEGWIFATVSAAVLLTTHSSVAILTVGRFARETGESFDVNPYRRANILDLTVCTYPFLLPFFIPTILMASTTAGIERLSAWQVGAHNFHSWALLAVTVLVIVTGWGRRAVSTTPAE